MHSIIGAVGGERSVPIECADADRLALVCLFPSLLVPIVPELPNPLVLFVVADRTQIIAHIAALLRSITAA